MDSSLMYTGDIDLATTYYRCILNRLPVTLP